MDKIPTCRMAMIVLLMLAGLAPLMTVTPGRAEVVDRIVAQVNDEIITQSEVEAMAKTIDPESFGNQPKGLKQLQKDMLEALIDRKLALAEAKRRGITISDKEMDQAMLEFKRRNNIPDDAAMDKALTQTGLTFKDVRDQVQGQLLQERLATLVMGTKVTVPETEVRRYYDEHAKESGGGQVHLQMIAFNFPANATPAQKEETQKKADAAMMEIRHGGPKAFSAVARKHELEVVDLGRMAEADMAPPLAEVVKRGKSGEVIPVQTPKGFQLIQLGDRQSGKTRPFEEVASRIREMLLRREMEKRYNDWVKTLRTKAVIKIMM